MPFQLRGYGCKPKQGLKQIGKPRNFNDVKKNQEI